MCGKIACGGLLFTRSPNISRTKLYCSGLLCAVWQFNLRAIKTTNPHVWVFLIIIIISPYVCFFREPFNQGYLILCWSFYRRSEMRSQFLHFCVFLSWWFAFYLIHIIFVLHFYSAKRNLNIPDERFSFLLLLHCFYYFYYYIFCIFRNCNGFFSVVSYLLGNIVARNL